MAKSVKITNQGLSLLASSSQATGQYYWLGYYALAYVPNLWKSDSVVLPPADTCNNVNGTPTIESTDTDKVTAAMTRLTKYGDVIYNVWQGDLNGTGYAGGVSDGSAGGDLFGLTMYDKNIKKHYRYVLDSNGNNTLVAWIDNETTTDGSLLGKHVYKGTDGFTYSELPIPAPLYYMGDIAGKTTVSDYFDEYPTFEDEYYNGSTIYPYITVNITSGGSALDVPKVSTDFRGYYDSLGNPAALPYNSMGAYFDSSEIPSGVSVNYDETGWFAANTTWGVGDSDSDYYYCTEFWKLHTISNYNRFHAPVDSIGHVLNSDLSNRNMAKATKFFPISNYKVISTETKFTSNSETIEVATAIKLGINIDLSPTTLATGFSDDGASLDENSNIEFFDAYADAGDSSVMDQYNQSIYKSTHTSFKFNRIGIYAVPMRTAAYFADEGFGIDNTTKDKKLQFQINPDEEPVLFAVIDWDNVVTLSDAGDGIHQFEAELNVNLQSPDDAESTSLVRDASIFYNLYQDDAQTWYQNQLIANASTSNAITELSLELAHIKGLGKSNECCPTPDLSDLFAAKNHSHNFMRNLRDANIKANGGLKGIDTAQEDTTLDYEVYKLGLDSVVLGYNTFVSANYSIVANGVNNYINRLSHESFIGSGHANAITYASIESAILSGHSNKISNSVNSLIGSSINSTIYGSIRSGILLGSTNIIFSDGAYGSTTSGLDNIIVGGFTNYIYNSQSSVIVNGSYNNVNVSSNSAIISGALNAIQNNSHYSFIGTGRSNYIRDSEYSVIMSANVANIYTSTHSLIGVGKNHYIGVSSSNSVILGGEEHIIQNMSPLSAILSGYKSIIENSVASVIVGGYGQYVKGNYSAITSGCENSIFGSDYSIIGGGLSNYISVQSLYSGIFSGIGNDILTSDNAFIGGGSTNYIYNGNSSSILGGASNKIINSDYSVILGGYNNIIEGFYDVGIFGNGISAHRNHAFMTNSLTLKNSSIELYNQTPAVGYVMSVSYIDGNVAMMEWSKNSTYEPYSNFIIVAEATYTQVIENRGIYTMVLPELPDEAGRTLNLDHNGMRIGDTCVLSITSDNFWTVVVNKDTEGVPVNPYTFIAGKMYTFICVKVNDSRLYLVGDLNGKDL